MYNEAREQKAKDLVRYGKYVYDNSYDNESGSYRNSLIEYLDTYFWVEKHNGIVESCGRSLRINTDNTSIYINLQDRFITISKNAILIKKPIYWIDNCDYIFKIQKNGVRTTDIKKLVLELLKNPERAEVWFKYWNK